MNEQPVKQHTVTPSSISHSYEPKQVSSVLCRLMSFDNGESALYNSMPTINDSGSVEHQLDACGDVVYDGGHCHRLLKGTCPLPFQI